MTKPRAIILIDGSNLYHRLKELDAKNLLRFDFTAWIETLCRDYARIATTYLVGVVRTEPDNPKSYELFRKQRMLFAYLEKLGITIYRGYLIKHPRPYGRGFDESSNFVCPASVFPCCLM